MIKRLQTLSNLRQKVFEAVRDFVINGGVTPGNKIDEAYLAESLGVSKTPVREALSILAIEGIVEIKPNRGSFKAKLTPKDIDEMGMIRESLEGLCMRLACKNMTPRVIQKLKALIHDFEARDFEKEYSAFAETNVKFHELIHKTAKSPRLVSLIQSNRDMTQMLRLKYFKNPENVRYALERHKELIKAFEKGDVELAVDIRQKMLRYGYRTYFHNLK